MGVSSIPAFFPSYRAFSLMWQTCGYFKCVKRISNYLKFDCYLVIDLIVHSCLANKNKQKPFTLIDLGNIELLHNIPSLLLQLGF